MSLCTGPSKAIELVNIAAYVDQVTTFTSQQKEPLRNVTSLVPITQRYTIFRLDYRHADQFVTSAPAMPAMLATLAPGQAREFITLGRLPDDTRISSSSHRGSISPINIAHTLCIIVTYVTEEGVEKVLVIRKPISIASVSSSTMPLNSEC